MESANIAANYVSQSMGRGPLAHWPYTPPEGSLPTSEGMPQPSRFRRAS